MSRLTYMGEARIQEEKPCVWKETDSDNGEWTGSCGAIWHLEEGSPKDNMMNFCPACGKKLKQRR